MTTQPLFLGLDLGTGGVRAMVVDLQGYVRARAAIPLPADACWHDAQRHEQSPAAWWLAVCRTTQAVVERLRHAGIPRSALQGLAVDGTSGTLLPVDAQGQALRNAIMYNDPRSAEAARQLNTQHPTGRLRFDASYALSKALWLLQTDPRCCDQTALWMHQADFINARLGAPLGITDASNALKTGYDLVADRWPDWLLAWPELADKLPRVVSPGEIIGEVSTRAAVETHLPAGMTIVAGLTDGVAGFLASGAARPGDVNTTLGTTLVFKMLTEAPIARADGAIYSHRLAADRWLPGAASNTGGQWTRHWFAGADLHALDAAAGGRLPCATLAWPLISQGERFPVAAPRARGFIVPESDDPLERYAACLQGVALVEKWALLELDAARAVSRDTSVEPTTGGVVFATGGGARSDVWLQCRADVSGRLFRRPVCPESAFGSAVLAAAALHFENQLSTAADSLVRIERGFEPDAARHRQYAAIEAEWHHAAEQHGFV